MAASGAWVGTIGAGGGNWEGARAELLRPGLSATGGVMGLDLSIEGAGWGTGAVTGDAVFLPAAAAGTALAVMGSLAGLTVTGVWLDGVVFGTAVTLRATGLGATSEASLETGLTAGFLAAGLGGMAALTTGPADFLTAALTPATGWVALAMGFTAVLSGVFGFTEGFAVALTTGDLTVGLFGVAACGRPSAANAAGPSGGVIRVFWPARDCSVSAGRRDAVKPNRWRINVNIRLHYAF